MEKIEREFDVNYNLDWLYGVDITTIRKDLDELEKLGATHVNIEHGLSYGDSYCNIEAVTIRLETDEEFKIRCDEYTVLQERQRNHELAQLEALKKKYENG